MSNWLHAAPPPPDLALTILSADFKPAVAKIEDSADPSAKPAPEAVGDTSDRALMFGRYLGQIRARVERAWLRPRTSVEGHEFSCQALIDQDAAGTVKAVELRDCNGDDRWQWSLIRAINMASPLPPPIDPSLRSNHLTMSFRSTQWSPNLRADEFEPAEPAVAALLR